MLLGQIPGGGRALTEDSVFRIPGGPNCVGRSSGHRDTLLISDRKILNNVSNPSILFGYTFPERREGKE